MQRLSTRKLWPVDRLEEHGTSPKHDKPISMELQQHIFKLQPNLRNQDMLSCRKGQKIRWLFGLRGLAAFLVYWHHHQIWAHDNSSMLVLELAFGFEEKYHFATLPGIRTLFIGGHLSVAMLFVISGFTSSIAPLGACYDEDYVTLTDIIASALSRRWFRIHIPLFITTFFYMSTWYLPLLGKQIRPSDASESWIGESWRFYEEFKAYSFIFGNLRQPFLIRYNDHLWTVMLELRGSIMVYLTVTALSRCTPKTRMSILVGLILYFLLFVDGWYFALFLSGAFLCELEIQARRRKQTILAQLTLEQAILWWGFLCLGVYFGNVPHVGPQTLRRMPGWYYLSFLIPPVMSDPKWFYLFWASSVLLLSIMRQPRLQHILEAPTLQFLGRISFGLYLVHGPVLWTLGGFLYAAFGMPVSSNVCESTGLKSSVRGWLSRGILGLEIGFLVPQAILLPVTLYLAHIVTMFVDEPSNRLLHEIYRKITV